MKDATPDRTLTPLEAEAVEMLLSGDDPLLERLRAQYGLAAIKHREFTGAGYVTRFEFRGIQGESPQVEGSFDISDVVAGLPGETDMLIFHLAIRNGYLDYFEAVTTGDEWPIEKSEHATLRYFDKEHPKGRLDRDLKSARQQWMGTAH
jgi:hypothetical protein